MRLGEFGIQLESPLRRLVGLRVERLHFVFRGKHEAHPGARDRQSGMGQRVVGIPGQRLLEGGHRLQRGRTGVRRQLRPAAHVQRVGVGIPSGLPIHARAILAAELNRKCLDDASGNVVLEAQQVGRAHRIGSAPHREAIGNPDQLRCDADLVADLLNRAGQYVIHAKRPAGTPGVVVLPPGSEDRHDANVPHERDPGNDGVGHADAEEPDFLHARQHLERQDRD